MASLAAIGFVDLVLLVNEWLLVSPRSRFMQDDRTWLLVATVLVPAAGGLVVGVVHYRLIPERRPHGPADVIRAVQGMDGRVPPRSGFLSAATSIVSLGGRGVRWPVRAARASRGDLRLARRPSQPAHRAQRDGVGGVRRRGRDRDRVQRAARRESSSRTR